MQDSVWLDEQSDVDGSNSRFSIGGRKSHHFGNIECSWLIDLDPLRSVKLFWQGGDQNTRLLSKDGSDADVAVPIDFMRATDVLINHAYRWPNAFGVT